MCVWATGATDARTLSQGLTFMFSTQKGVAMDSRTKTSLERWQAKLDKYEAERLRAEEISKKVDEIIDWGYNRLPLEFKPKGIALRKSGNKYKVDGKRKKGLKVWQ